MEKFIQGAIDMKRIMQLLALLMILALVPVTAQAGYENEATFNKYCKWRMSSSSTLYKERHFADENGIIYETIYEPIGTLPAGKYVATLASDGQKTEVFYWNGGRKCAWVDSDAISWAGRTIYATNGNKTSIPALAWGDEAVVREILGEFLSEEEVQSYIDGMNQGLTGEKDENGQIVIVKQEPLTPPVITLKQDGIDTEVDMLIPGVVNSTIRLNGNENVVPTALLSWDAGEAEHPLARIYAPKNGVASVYARDDGKGGVIKKFKTGSIVLVLGKSGKYTKVFGESTVGYVITSALEFSDIVTDAQEMTVTRRAYLHLVARESGHRLAELPEGTVVHLIEEKKQWAQVEYQGFVGYVEVSKLEK